jgi:hypothetical protein
MSAWPFIRLARRQKPVWCGRWCEESLEEFGSTSKHKENPITKEYETTDYIRSHWFRGVLFAISDGISTAQLEAQPPEEVYHLRENGDMSENLAQVVHHIGVDKIATLRTALAAGPSLYVSQDVATKKLAFSQEPIAGALIAGPLTTFAVISQDPQRNGMYRIVTS